jgi:hypothetical protein
MAFINNTFLFFALLIKNRFARPSSNSFLFRAAFFRGDQIANNVCGVTTWPALANVTELCDITHLLQTLGMCPLRANVTPLLYDVLGTRLPGALFMFIAFSNCFYWI